jgi:hypothetical protein
MDDNGLDSEYMILHSFRNVKYGCDRMPNENSKTITDMVYFFYGIR